MVMVRTCKESKPVKDTHLLERVEVGTSQNIGRSELARGTHLLERAEVESGQDIERKKAEKSHLLPREVRGWDIL